VLKVVCQECQKRPAALHFTKIINGEKTEVHLCEKCAQDKGETFLSNGTSGFSINNLLAGLLNMEPVFQQQNPETISRSDIIQCPHCNMTFQTFVKTGRFGCANCYLTFKEHLTPIIKRLHSGNDVHHGKVPKRIGGSIHVKKQIQQLKQQLQQLVNNEEFEKAADIRDEIRSLENLLRQEESGS